MNWKLFGGKVLWSGQCNILIFAWTDWRNAPQSR